MSGSTILGIRHPTAGPKAILPCTEAADSPCCVSQEYLEAILGEELDVDTGIASGLQVLGGYDADVAALGNGGTGWTGTVEEEGSRSVFVTDPMHPQALARSVGAEVQAQEDVLVGAHTGQGRCEGKREFSWPARCSGGSGRRT